MSTDRDSFEVMLDGFTAGTRGERVHLALRSLARSNVRARLMIAELSWEVHSLRLWTVLRDEQGRVYRSAFAYFQDIADDQLSRQWRYHLSLGKGIRSFPAGQRNWLRDQLARLGIYRAMQMGRLLLQRHDAAEVSRWIDRGTQSTSREFAAIISEELRSSRGPHAGEACPTCGRRMKSAKVAR